MLSDSVQSKVKNSLSSKKGKQEIQKALYYQYDIFPEIFSGQSDELRSAKMNKVNYYTYQTKSTTEVLWNEQILIQCARKTYLSDYQSLKLNNTLYKRIIDVKIPYYFIRGVSEQIIDFHFQQQPLQNHELPEIGKQKKVELFIIHHCHPESDNSIKWLHFIERYTFHKGSFQYYMTASIKAEDTYLLKNQKLFKQFMNTIRVVQSPKIFEGFLLQHQMELKYEAKKQTDPAFSPEQRAINRIKPENIKCYHTLQKQFPEENESLICRYLIAKQYDMSQTRTSLKQYVTWRNDIKSKWKYEDFEEFHAAKIFTYLGEDRQGRPVVINKASNVRVKQIDLDKYSIYYIYFLQIYIPSIMRGHVSQILIIADVEDVGIDNFKFSVTRQNLEDNVKYGPERQYKIIAINVGSFALYWWRIVKPMLPKRSVNKIEIAGSQKESIYQAMEEEMDHSVIPDYLGGGNVLE